MGFRTQGWFGTSPYNAFFGLADQISGLEGPAQEIKYFTDDQKNCQYCQRNNRQIPSPAQLLAPLLFNPNPALTLDDAVAQFGLNKVILAIPTHRPLLFAAHQGNNAFTLITEEKDTQLFIFVKPGPILDCPIRCIDCFNRQA